MPGPAKFPSVSVSRLLLLVSSTRRKNLQIMGARHSKRSVDISAASKKDNTESNSEEKLGKIEEPEVAKQNGTTTPRPDESKDAGGEATTAEMNGEESEKKDDKAEKKTEETPEKKEEGKENKEPQTPESPAEDSKSPDAKSPEDGKKTEKKKKDKKKWSIRSISFSRKDKTKPNMSKEDSITNDLAKVADAVAEVVEDENASKEKKEETTATPPADEEKTAPLASPLSGAISSIASAASSVAEEVKDKVEEKKEEFKSAVVSKTEETIEEGSAIIQKSVEEVVEKTSSVVESVSSSITTTITESSQVITSSTQMVQEILEIKSEETPAPPLPASPPPTEAPPPTPIVLTQPEHEEMNGGGEGMAEMPEENGIGSDGKIDDDEEEMPKLNGHNVESPVKQVENIIDALKSEVIEKHVVAENNGELVTNHAAAGDD
ncbi:Hypothetical protein NTJ_07588 [Nesidiocoris tenuis]|uniref:Uncharacterized protein n=1 Tax=Nesidiocoris tenuis TaxID=355587 RepID=A0ABN7ARE3_9HEMI|nr:Hypothetical protein NTJ_07588 [Nesidiocoris tenuis]